MEIKNFKGTVAIVCDPHVPDHDRDVQSVQLQIIRDIKPRVVILDGDIFDFYQISRFNTDPAREETMQDELDLAHSYLKTFRYAAPDAEIIENDGNHEDRLRRFLWTEGRRVRNLRALKLDNLYGLEELGIKRELLNRGVFIDNIFRVIHGDIVRKHSGYTAKATMEKYGGCGLHGHSHRGGNHLKTDASIDWGWWEGYCSCRLDPEYDPSPNWQQGMVVIDFWGSQRFYVQPVQIIKGKAQFGSKKYIAEKKEWLNTSVPNPQSAV